jgi:hypothetical protein
MTSDPRELLKYDLAVDEPGISEILRGELLQGGIVECRLEALGEHGELRGDQCEPRSSGTRVRRRRRPEARDEGEVQWVKGEG